MRKKPRPVARLAASVLEAVAAHASGGPAGLGLSGGMDSVVLAEAMRRGGVPFTALHLDHGWRGERSRADAAWVRQWCRERGIPFRGARLRPGRADTENAAREARRAFFGREAARGGWSEVWLAHHGDDQAETFLLQLLRGAGPEGLGGMRGRRRLGDGLLVVRPLLGFTKVELRRVARHWKLSWREDATNRSPAFFRNRVRGRLLPYLSRLAGREVSPLLRRTAELIRAENEDWEARLPATWPECPPVHDWRVRSTAWQRRAIRGWLGERGVEGVGFAEIELVRALLAGARPAKANLPGGRHCRRRQGRLFLE